MRPAAQPCLPFTTPPPAEPHPARAAGIHYDPNDQRMWYVRRRCRCCHAEAPSDAASVANRRVGTEAYAPPEIFFPGADGYDATKYDVWSLGIILFLMLCIDALDIIQIPEMSTGARRTTLRMPFLSYANVIYPLRGNATGACGNLTNQLDDPPASACAASGLRVSGLTPPLAAGFTGLLTQHAPTHERFWRHFPVRSQKRLRLASSPARCDAACGCRRRRSGCRRRPRT